MTLILGIDPGLQHTGWGVIRAGSGQISFIACGTINSHAQAPMEQRLKQLHDGITQAITLYTPQEVAIEETFMNNNARSALKLGQARGALILSVSLAGLPMAEYSATMIKKSVVGTGRADKNQMGMMVKTLLPASQAQTADAADALAVAICHAHHRTVSTLTQRAQA